MTDGEQDGDTTTSAHDRWRAGELEAERSYARFVQQVVKNLREYLETGGIHEDVEVLSAAVRRALVETRKQHLEDLRKGGPPFFGRIERHDRRGALYVGRSLVRNPGQTPEQPLEDEDLLVVSWQAPAASAFYLARPGRAAGLRRKRSYEWTGDYLANFREEQYSEREAVTPDDGVGVLSLQDAVLRDLERERDPFMRDIVSTIQADQYVVLERPAKGVLIVQGAPGTGKTAVALHRLSFLAFNHPHLRSRGLMLVGPSPRFLRYVSQVLPSLGDTDVRHSTVAELVSRVETIPSERRLRAAKGNGAWAGLLRHEVLSRLRPLKMDRRVKLGSVALILSVQESESIIRRAQHEASTYPEARETLRKGIAQVLSRQYVDAVGGSAHIRVAEYPDPEGELIDGRPVQELVNRLAPPLESGALLRELLAEPERLLRSGAQHLSVDVLEELAAAAAPGQFDADDTVLIDELNYLLGEETEKFGHLAVDEAQDFTDMELRAIARRAGVGGITLVGDLGQASLVPRQTWAEVASVLSTSRPTVVELRLSYRVPGQVLDYANRLLRASGVDVSPGVPVRQTSGALTLHTTPTAENLWDMARVAAERRRTSSNSVAVIAHSSRWVRGLSAGDLDSIDGSIERLDEVTCKGLEFDYVILIEPADFLKSPLGHRALYVAVTRCTQSLEIIHNESVPEMPEFGTDPLEESADVHAPEALREALQNRLNQVEHHLAGNPTDDPDLEEVLSDGYALLAALTESGHEGDSRREALIRSCQAVVALADQLLSVQES